MKHSIVLTTQVAALFILSIIFLAGCSTNPGKEVPADNFIAYSFDNSLVEEHHIDTLEGHDIAFVPDRNGREKSAVYFNGKSAYLANSVNQDYVKASYCFWMKADSVKTESALMMMGNTCTSGFGLMTLTDNESGRTPLIVLCGGVIVNPTVSDYEPVAGEWVHLALVKDTFTFSIFVNGKLSSSGATLYHACNGKMTIGAGDCQRIGSFFEGTVDDLYIFPKALTEREIARVMKGGKQ